jgi:hypothetical protein
MARQWTEETAKWLCVAAGAALIFFAAVIGGRVAAYKGLWRVPDMGTWANIALWVVLAAALLFAMDRGIPREGPWSSRLYWMRRGLLVASFATIAAMAWLK